MRRMLREIRWGGGGWWKCAGEDKKKKNLGCCITLIFDEYCTYRDHRVGLRLWGEDVFFHRCGGRDCLKENGVDINLSLTLDHTDGWNAWRIPWMGRLRQNTHCAGGSRMVWAATPTGRDRDVWAATKTGRRLTSSDLQWPILACQDARHAKTTHDDDEEEERKDWSDYDLAADGNKCVWGRDRERDGEALVGLEVIRICGRGSLNTSGMTAYAHALLATCWLQSSAVIGVGSCHSSRWIRASMSHKTNAWMDFLLILCAFLKHSDLNYFDI